MSDMGEDFRLLREMGQQKRLDNALHRSAMRKDESGFGGAGGVDAGQQEGESPVGAKAVRLGDSVHSQAPPASPECLRASGNQNGDK